MRYTTLFRMSRLEPVGANRGNAVQGCTRLSHVVLVGGVEGGTPRRTKFFLFSLSMFN